ncbi:MAG: hypothetical protein R3C16_05080 [Hyphomonadaceae bacterium]
MAQAPRPKANPEKELRDTFRKAYRKFNSELPGLRKKAGDDDAAHDQLDKMRLEFASTEWEFRRTELDTATVGFEAMSREAAALGKTVANDVKTWKSVKAASEAIGAFFGLLARVIVGFRI